VGNLLPMRNEYYAPGEQRAGQVNALFARIARRYDLINDLQSFRMHRRWKRRVAQLAVAHGPTQAEVLDVCCGTGDVSFALAGLGAQVTGVDFTAEMLAIAQTRGQGRPPIKFLQGDALQLPFAQASFDAATVAYGLRNVADWKQGLAEMCRVVRPGGTVVVLDCGKPDFAPWQWLYFTYLRLFVPVLGFVFYGDPATYSYILESLQHYPSQHGVAATMRELGLREVQIINLLWGAMTIHVGRK